MTNLSGRIRTTHGDRMHIPFFHLLTVTASLGIAAAARHGMPLVWDHGATFDFESKQFACDVKLPLVGPIEHMLADTTPDSIEFLVVPRGTNASLTTRTLPKLTRLMDNLVALVFVEFFETHRSWLLENVGEPQTWPPVLNFARVVRNAAAHGGMLHIVNPDARAATWHNLVYEPQDNGRQVIGGDLEIAELVILMFESGIAFDNLGCPVQPV